jgi:proline iminopeptidase
MSLRHSLYLVALVLVLLGGVTALTGARAFAPPPITVERDPSLPRVELKGYPFHAEAFGPAGKPVVIVLHGGPGADYRYLLGLQALAGDYQVVFYDQRGTGLSPRVPAESISVQTFIEDLDAFVDAFGHGRPVHLLGHSWGAMLASAYTGHHPEKIASLVLAEPGFLDVATQDVFAAHGLPPLRVIWGIAVAWLGQWFVPTLGYAHARVVWLVSRVLPLALGPVELCDGRLPPLQAWRFGSPNFKATVGRMMDEPAFGRQLDFRRGVDAFRGPTLFLAGACNRVGGEAHQRRMLGHFAHARLEVVPGAGHFMFNDQPEDSLARVRAFLAEATR